MVILLGLAIIVGLITSIVLLCRNHKPKYLGVRIIKNPKDE